MPRPPFQRDLFPRTERSLGNGGSRTEPTAVPPLEHCRRALHRRGGTMAGVVVVTMLAAWAATRCREPVFVSTATVVGQDLVPAVQTPAPIAPTRTNASPEGLQTIAEELGARDSVAAALAALGPRRAAALPLHWLRPNLLPGGGAPSTPIADAALRQLQIAVLPQSRVIQLQFQAASPKLAVDFLDALLSSYLERTQARQRSLGLARVNWLSAQADSARGQIEQAQAALADLARGHGLADPAEQASLAAQRWQQLASAENTAEIAAWQQADAARSGAPFSSGGTADESTAFSDLEVRRAAAAAEVMRLSAIYRPQAAPLQQAKQQLDSLDASLTALRDQARQARDRALASAQLQVQDLRDQLAKQAQRQAGLVSVLGAWDMDQRQLRANQTLYSNLLDQRDEAAAEAGAPDLPLRVADPAAAPPRAARPELAANLSMGFVLGCVLAVAAAWLLEVSDPRLFWPEAGELGVPLVAYTEAGYAAAAAAALAAQRSGAAALLVVGARAGAGATTVLAGLAREVASAVGTLLVLESNPRSPTPSDGAGLGELLAGHVALEEVLRRARGRFEPDRIALGAADVRPSLALSLAAGAGAELLNGACARYPMVLIDGGAVLEASEPSYWAGCAGFTLLVADRKTSRRQLRRALDRLEESGAAHIGLVLHGVPAPKRWIAPPLSFSSAPEPVTVLRQHAR